MGRAISGKLQHKQIRHVGLVAGTYQGTGAPVPFLVLNAG